MKKGQKLFPQIYFIINEATSKEKSPDTEHPFENENFQT